MLFVTSPIPWVRVVGVGHPVMRPRRRAPLRRVLGGRDRHASASGRERERSV